MPHLTEVVRKNLLIKNKKNEFVAKFIIHRTPITEQ